MKRFKEYIINEWKLTDDSDIEKKPLFKFFPKSQKELRELVIERLKDNNEDPYLLDIDISSVDCLNNLFSGGCGTNNDYHGDYYDYLYKVPEIDMSKLKRIDLSTWDTSNVRFVRNLFCKCINLKKVIGIENWDLCNCFQFDGMFRKCESLETLDISNWKVRARNVNKSWMFAFCHILKEIKGIDKLSALPNTAADMTYMFYECDKLDIPRWYNKEKWERSGF